MKIEVLIRRKNPIQIGERKIKEGVLAVLRGLVPPDQHPLLVVEVTVDPHATANRVEVTQTARIAGRALFDGHAISDPGKARRLVADAVNEGLASKQRHDNFTFTNGWEPRATPGAAPQRLPRDRRSGRPSASSAP